MCDDDDDDAVMMCDETSCNYILLSLLRADFDVRRFIRDARLLRNQFVSSSSDVYSASRLQIFSISEPSRRVCKPAYSKLVPKPGNMEGIWCKNTLGCVAGLTLAIICVAAGGQPMRGPAINQQPHQIQN